MKRISLTLLALIALIIAVVMLPSCQATGFGRKAPVAVSQKGKIAALVWSAANCPEEWDKSLSPLDPFQPVTPLLNREDPLYWRKVFDPSNH